MLASIHFVVVSMNNKIPFEINSVHSRTNFVYYAFIDNTMWRYMISCFVIVSLSNENVCIFVFDRIKECLSFFSLFPSFCVHGILMLFTCNECSLPHLLKKRVICMRSRLLSTVQEKS